MPVYAWWLRVNISKHEYCGPSTSGVPQKEWTHVEMSPTRGPVGLFQKFTAKTIKSDGQRFALLGHDTGPMIPHICNPPDNVSLLATMMGSKCKWPVSANRLKFENGIPCAFQQLIVPYIHCHARGNGKGEDKSGTPGTSGGASAGGSGGGSDDKVTIGGQVPGLGLVMIPTGPQTVDWRLGLWDYVLGIANVMIDMTFDYLWKRYDKAPGVSGMQKSVAKRLAKTEAERKCVEKILDGTAKEYLKGLLSSAEVRAPFKLAKFDLKTGKITVWKSEVGSVDWKLTDSVPYDFRGWSPLLDPGNPVLDDLLGEVPHAD